MIKISVRKKRWFVSCVSTGARAWFGLPGAISVFLLTLTVKLCGVPKVLQYQHSCDFNNTAQ